MPAKMTEPGVGASTWASGNHKWNGTIGTLTEKPINNKIQIKSSLFSVKEEFKKKSKDKLPLLNKKSKITINTKMDPKMVYKNNWYEALILRILLPHIPIKKNIGITINSKNKKK